MYYFPDLCFNSLTMDREEALKIYKLGEEVTVEKLLELSAEIDRLKGTSPTSPTTPSGQTPPFLKPNKKKRKKKPGQKPGHKGFSRTHIKPGTENRTVHHPLENCPNCGTSLVDYKPQTNDRYIEDLADTKTEIVKHVEERKFCPCCKKLVKAPFSDALPGSVIGLKLAIFSAFLHYFIGISLRNIQRVLKAVDGHVVTIGGLAHIWGRLANLLEGQYTQIAQEIKTARVVGGDETGWRIAGKLGWLWAFVTDNACIYLIEPFRNGKVVKRFLGKKFRGTLICDFWGAYNKIAAAFKQRCLYHLFTELRKVDAKTPSSNQEIWEAWCKKLSRLLKDGLRLSRKLGKIPAEDYNRLKETLLKRLEEMIQEDSLHKDVKRLSKRLRRHQSEIFTFLDNPNGVSPFNNISERAIRLAVLMRKISQQNRSFKSARTQAILMTIFKTAHMRGQNPYETVLSMVKNILKTRKKVINSLEEEKLAA